MEGNAIGILQERMQKIHESPPFYECVLKSLHSIPPEFKFSVTVGDKIAYGSGGSMKEAKQNAARSMLCDLDSMVVPNTGKNLLRGQNHIGELQTHCLHCNLSLPVYTEAGEQGLHHSKTFFIEVSVGELRERGEGTTKQDAKHKAAYKLLKKLKGNLNLVEQTDIPVFRNKFNEENNLVEMKLKDEINSSNYPMKVKHFSSKNIANSHLYFKDPSSSTSMTLEKLKTMNEDYLLRMKIRSKEVVENIMTEMGVKYRLESLPDHVGEDVSILLILDTEPKWTFIGHGKSSKEAKQDVFHQAFEFIIELST